MLLRNYMTLLKQYNASAFIMFKSILLSTLRAFFVSINPLRLVEPRSQLILNVAVHNSLISFYKIIYKKRIVTLCPNKIYFLENSTCHARPENVAKICFVKYFTCMKRFDLPPQAHLGLVASLQTPNNVLQ